jgi:predicted nucleotidyltransferase
VRAVLPIARSSDKKRYPDCPKFSGRTIRELGYCLPKIAACVKIILKYWAWVVPMKRGCNKSACSMVIVPEEAVLSRVKPVLSAEKEIAGAYLFGSALGMCRPDSDIDLGLIIQPLTGQPDVYYEQTVERVLSNLSGIGRHKFDIVPLNLSNAIFAFKVLKEGKLIFSAVPRIVADFMESISRQYGENYPRYRDALKIIVGV